MDPIAVSIAETGRALSLGRTTVYALINSGRLKTIKLGRRTLVMVESVHSLVEKSQP